MGVGQSGGLKKVLTKSTLKWSEIDLKMNKIPPAAPALYSLLCSVISFPAFKGFFFKGHSHACFVEPFFRGGGY